MFFDVRFLTTFLALALPLASVASSGVAVDSSVFLQREGSTTGQLIRVQLYQSRSFDELAEELGLSLGQLLHFNSALASEELAKGDWISLPAELEPLLPFSLSLDIGSVMHVDPTRSRLQPHPEDRNSKYQEGDVLLSMKPGTAGLSWPALGQPVAKISDMVFANRWEWPAQGLVTSGYGWRHGRMHAGIDIANRIGTPVLAAADGHVQFASWHNGGYGYMVELLHADGSRSIYAHNSSLQVEKNQYVRQGDVLALMGCTGICTGPHLHFEIHPDGYGAVDPMIMLPS